MAPVDQPSDHVQHLALSSWVGNISSVPITLRQIMTLEERKWNNNERRSDKKMETEGKMGFRSLRLLLHSFTFGIRVSFHWKLQQ